MNMHWTLLRRHLQGHAGHACMCVPSIAPGQTAVCCAQGTTAEAQHRPVMFAWDLHAYKTQSDWSVIHCEGKHRNSHGGQYWTSDHPILKFLCGPAHHSAVCYTHL